MSASIPPDSRRQGRKSRAQLMQERGAAEFTGRAREVALFESMLESLLDESNSSPAAKVSPKNILNVWGEGGMGKSSLVAEYERICRRRNIIPVTIDAQAANPANQIRSLIDFMAAVRQRLGALLTAQSGLESPFAAFDRAAAALTELESQRERDSLRTSGESAPSSESSGRQSERISRPKLSDAVVSQQQHLIERFVEALTVVSGYQPTVILIDTYEELLLQGLDTQIRERVLIHLPGDVVIVLAGRNSITDYCSPNWRDMMESVQLADFTEEECGELLRRKGLDDRELARAVHSFTQGVPLAVGFAADICTRESNIDAATRLFAGGPDASGGRAEIIARVASRFLSLVPRSEREMVEACAVLGLVSPESLSHVLGREVTRDDVQRLEGYSFMRHSNDDFVMHSTVRSYTLRNLRLLDRRLYSKLHWRAAEYATRRLVRARFAADLLKVSQQLSAGRAASAPESVLRDLMSGTLGAEDLKTLCVDLDPNLTYDDLPGEGRVDKIRELILYCGRRGVFHRLIELLTSIRPNTDWTEVAQQLKERSASQVGFVDSLRNAPVLVAEYDDPAWRQWSLARLYHILQADTDAGEDMLWLALADASWEGQYTYTLDAIGALDQPVATDSPAMQALRPYYVARDAKDSRAAEAALNYALTLVSTSPWFGTIVHDEYGSLIKSEIPHRSLSAVSHFEFPLQRYRRQGDLERVAATIANISECYAEQSKWQAALELLKQGLETPELGGNAICAASCIVALDQSTGCRAGTASRWQLWRRAGRGMRGWTGRWMKRTCGTGSGTRIGSGGSGGRRWRTTRRRVMRP